MIDSSRVPPLPKLSSSISMKSTSSELNSFRTDDSRAHYTSAALYRNDWHFHQQDDLVTPCQGQKRRDFATTTNNMPPTSETTSTTGNDARLLSDFCNWTSAKSSQSPLSSYDGSVPQAPTLAVPTGGNKKTQYHKTKMCPWHREGKCFMGSACNYAHSREELRPKPDLSKTKLCPEIMKGRQCTRTCCRFAHDFVELRATAAFFKTRLCKYWQRGNCPAGRECRHAHGRDEVRAPAIPPAEPPVSGLTDTTGASTARSGFNSSSASYAPSPHGGAGGRKWPDGFYNNTMSNSNKATDTNVIGGVSGMVMVPPAASQLPSPSFLSTSGTSSSTPPSPNGRNGHVGLPSLQECAALLNGSNRPGGDEGALTLLKSWISQEVERQVQIRQHEINTTNPSIELPGTGGDEACFLPADILQGLNTTTPAARGGGWLSGANGVAAGMSPTDGSSPATFAAAVQSMTAGDDRTPTHLLLKTLGDLSSSWGAAGVVVPSSISLFESASVTMHNAY